MFIYFFCWFHRVVFLSCSSLGFLNDNYFGVSFQEIPKGQPLALNFLLFVVSECLDSLWSCKPACCVRALSLLLVVPRCLGYAYPKFPVKGGSEGSPDMLRTHCFLQVSLTATASPAWVGGLLGATPLCSVCLSALFPFRKELLESRAFSYLTTSKDGVQSLQFPAPMGPLKFKCFHVLLTLPG